MHSCFVIYSSSPIFFWGRKVLCCQDKVRCLCQTHCACAVQNNKLALLSRKKKMWWCQEKITHSSITKVRSDSELCGCFVWVWRAERGSLQNRVQQTSQITAWSCSTACTAILHWGCLDTRRQDKKSRTVRLIYWGAVTITISPFPPRHSCVLSLWL